jgi:hypothetical protein
MKQRKYHNVYVIALSKAGIQSNRYVMQYGLHLLPDLYEGFNPMTYEDACDQEIEIAIDLRSAGFGVWQA